MLNIASDVVDSKVLNPGHPVKTVFKKQASAEKAHSPAFASLPRILYVYSKDKLFLHYSTGSGSIYNN